MFRVYGLSSIYPHFRSTNANDGSANPARKHTPDTRDADSSHIDGKCPIARAARKRSHSMPFADSTHSSDTHTTRHKQDTRMRSKRDIHSRSRSTDMRMQLPC